MSTLQGFQRRGVPPRLSAVVFALAVIAVFTTGMQATKADDDTAAVMIENYAYSPTPLTIAAGRSVRFTNHDDVAHTVTDEKGAFDSGMIDKGKSWTYKFDKPGTYTYYCTVHPSMKGTITVTSP